MVELFSGSVRQNISAAFHSLSRSPYQLCIRSRLLSGDSETEVHNVHGESSSSESGSDCDTWNVPKWLNSLDVIDVIAEVLLPTLDGDDSEDSFGEDEKSLKDAVERKHLEHARALASEGADGIKAMLEKGQVLDKLARTVFAGAQELVHQGVASPAEFVSKFSQAPGSFEMTVAGLDVFFKGLEPLIGSPHSKLLLTMFNEHTAPYDRTPFVTKNYGLRTTSMIEWAIVVEPDGGKRQACDRVAEIMKKGPNEISEALEFIVRDYRKFEQKNRDPFDSLAGDSATTSQFVNRQSDESQKRSDPMGMWKVMKRRTMTDFWHLQASDFRTKEPSSFLNDRVANFDTDVRPDLDCKLRYSLTQLGPRIPVTFFSKELGIFTVPMVSFQGCGRESRASVRARAEFMKPAPPVCGLTKFPS